MQFKDPELKKLDSRPKKGKKGKRGEEKKCVEVSACHELILLSWLFPILRGQPAVG